MSVAHGYDDYVLSLAIQQAAEIPCTARSLTREEAQIEDWKEIAWKLFVLIGFGLFTLWVWWGSTEPNLGTWLIVGYACVAIYVGFLVSSRLGKRRGYADPRIEIDVREAGLDLHGPSGGCSLPYEQLVVTRMLSSTAGRGGRRFDGLILKTPLGKIRLEDDWYLNGEAAAGAILKRLQALGLARSAME